MSNGCGRKRETQSIKFLIVPAIERVVFREAKMNASPRDQAAPELFCARRDPAGLLDIAVVERQLEILERREI